MKRPKFDMWERRNHTQKLTTNRFSPGANSDAFSQFPENKDKTPDSSLKSLFRDITQNNDFTRKVDSIIRNLNEKIMTSIKIEETRVNNLRSNIEPVIQIVSELKQEAESLQNDIKNKWQHPESDIQACFDRIAWGIRDLNSILENLSVEENTDDEVIELKKLSKNLKSIEKKASKIIESIKEAAKQAAKKIENETKKDRQFLVDKYSKIDASFEKSQANYEEAARLLSEIKDIDAPNKTEKKEEIQTRIEFIEFEIKLISSPQKRANNNTIISRNNLEVLVKNANSAEKRIAMELESIKEIVEEIKRSEVNQRAMENLFVEIQEIIKETVTKLKPFKDEAEALRKQANKLEEKAGKLEQSKEINRIPTKVNKIRKKVAEITKAAEIDKRAENATNVFELQRIQAKLENLVHSTESKLQAIRESVKNINDQIDKVTLADAQDVQKELKETAANIIETKTADKEDLDPNKETAENITETAEKEDLDPNEKIIRKLEKKVENLAEKFQEDLQINIKKANPDKIQQKILRILKSKKVDESRVNWKLVSAYSIYGYVNGDLHDVQKRVDLEIKILREGIQAGKYRDKIELLETLNKLQQVGSYLLFNRKKLIFKRKKPNTKKTSAKK